MSISYKKLWKLLIDKELTKSDLAKMADLSRYTLNKLNHGENVNAETLAKICKALNCGFDDIMEIKE
jgi:DNA-binding Xre family transcriptional regulator